ncbi:MAG: glycosyltransferase family 4 protein, partial [Solirubrobacteraceae bacterium]
PRAVVLSPDPSNRSGGMERFCQLLAGVLGDAGWDVDVVGPGAPPARWVDRAGAGTFARSRTAIAQAVELLPDLVVGNNHLGWGAPRGVPHIQVYHGTIAGLTRAAGGGLPVQERLRRKLFAAGCEALAGRDATVIAVSRGTADELQRRYRLRADGVIANGIDTDVFRPRDRDAARTRFAFTEPTALFVGRAEWGKGADVLVEGARAAGFAVAHAGDRELPGSRSLGVLDADALAEALSGVDCLLAPTRYEACSYAILEAMACGAPVVTTRVGWMQDLHAAIPGYRDLIIEPDVASIAAGLTRLQAGNPAGLVKAARAHVLAHNSLDAFARAWREQCEAAVATRMALLEA